MPESHSKQTHKEPLADFKVGVDNVIFSVDSVLNRLLVLLVMRHEDPYLNQWSLPGTLVRRSESLEQAAYRILSEKIRVQNLYLEQLYSFGDPDAIRGKRPINMEFGIFRSVILP